MRHDLPYQPLTRSDPKRIAAWMKRQTSGTTRCGGYNQQQFPENGFFAAVSDGLWDNGAACGRRYRVRCISGPRGSCKNGEITVIVVDFCKNTPCHAMMLLSKAAFSAISSIPDANINVEYTE
ncbi:hypothetical protein Ancab_002646 [Ancistrocladus abbreviatus]